MKNVSPCAQCKADVWIPDVLYEAAKKSPHIGFYCAYGHQLHYAEGDSEETKLRRERDRLQQRLAEKDGTIARVGREKAAIQGQMTKLKKRASHGVCPCCNRTFANVARHMQSKHPAYAKPKAVSA